MYVYPYYTLSCVSSVHIYGIYVANTDILIHIYIYMCLCIERERKKQGANIIYNVNPGLINP